MSQSLGGFGCIESDYILLQIGFTWAYEFSDKLPIRLGYTYSSNPINNDVTFFNIPATAIIKNAYMFGFSYEVNNRFSLDAVYHHGASDGKTSRQILNPMFIGSYPPYGAIPGSKVSYDMTIDMFW